eukprot:scaffold17468_cov106-Cylindrotheca_fusiformis.AAC.5
MAKSMILISAVPAVAFVISSMTRATNDSNLEPYFTPALGYNLCLAVAAPYTLLSHLWVLAFSKATLRSKVVKTAEKSNGIAVVTGSNTGLGFETAQSLATDYGYEVVLACRSVEKAIKAKDLINEAVLSTTHGGKAVVLEEPLDLSDFGSVRHFAKSIQRRYPHTRIDLLINNAGRNSSGKSGKLDLLFQTNFLGSFLLTSLLVENLKGGKVVNLSSVMHHFAGQQPKNEEFWRSIALYNPERPPEGYSASKLAAILFSNELNRRYSASHGIRSISVNPGSCSTDIWRDFPKWMQNIFRLIYLTPAQGSAPIVAAAVRDDWGDKTYLQPYWLPAYNSASLPFMEMAGPYIGYAAATPRLSKDDGRQAATALWNVSHELTQSAFI